MYFLNGFRSNVETVTLLSWPYSPSGIHDYRSLKKAYQKYLAKLQPGLPKSSLLEPHFNNDRQDLEKFAEAFNEESALRDIKSALLLTDFEKAPEKLSFIQKAYAQIQSRYPELGQLFSLTFNTIFSLPSAEAGGGSASSAIGVLWANPRKTWSENDGIEFLIHELAHNLVFLDEHRFGHYVDLSSAVKKENWAYSAILGRLRPIDKGVHSLLVAVEILSFRDAFTGHQGHYRVHPPSRILREKSLACIESLLALKNRDQLFRPRCLELILRCRERLLALNPRDLGASSVATTIAMQTSATL